MKKEKKTKKEELHCPHTSSVSLLELPLVAGWRVRSLERN